MADPTMTNFGARKNPMLTLANPAKAYPDWSLPSDQAVNFIAGSIARTEIPAGAKLYRVYGGPARINGAYWSPDKPDEKTEGDWRSQNAVEPWWNAGTDVAVLTVKDGTSIHVWSGGITSQPALYANGDRIPDYFLVGGGRQCFVQSWLPEIRDAIEIAPDGRTPWKPSTDDTYRVTPNVQPSGDVDSLKFTDPVQKVAIYLYEGGTAMRALAKVLDAVHATDPKAAGGPADMAADNLITLANSILRNLATDPQAARDIAKRAAGLRRVIDIDTSMLTGPDAKTAQQADALLTVIVNGAAMLVQDG